MLALTQAFYDLVTRIAAATTVAGAWDYYIAAARDAGLPSGLSCFSFSKTPLANRLVAHSMPDGWLEYYAGQDYAPHNPLAARGRSELRPFEWRPTDWDAIATPLQRRWRDDQLDTRMCYGITVPHLTGSAAKVITLAGPSDDVRPLDRMALQYAGLETLYRMSELGAAPATPDTHQPLSHRESECLQWIAAGKSDWEIGEILTLSEKTVNVYVERAKHKMGAATRAQAIVLALRWGLIAP